MKTLLLDIETLPIGAFAHRAEYGAAWRDHPPAVAVAAVGSEPQPVVVEPSLPPATWKDPAKIAARVALNADKAARESEVATEKARQAWSDQCWSYFRGGALGSGSHVRGKCADGRVHTICLTTGNGVVGKMASYPEQERDLLLWLLDRLKESRPQVIVTFGAFDCQFIGYRALVHKLDELADRALPRHYRIDAMFRLYDRPKLVDVRDMVEITHGRGMDAVCRAMGIDHDESNPITGADVLDAYLDGREDEILSHCLADVRDMEAMYRRLARIHRIPYTPQET